MKIDGGGLLDVCNLDLPAGKAGVLSGLTVSLRVCRHRVWFASSHRVRPGLHPVDGTPSDRCGSRAYLLGGCSVGVRSEGFLLLRH